MQKNAKFSSAGGSALQTLKTAPIANFWLRAWSRKRHVSMQNCYRYFVSDYDMKQCVKTIFQRPAILIFRAHSTFCQSVAQLGRRGLNPICKSLRKFNLKIRAFKRILDLTKSKGGLRCKEIQFFEMTFKV